MRQLLPRSCRLSSSSGQIRCGMMVVRSRGRVGGKVAVEDPCFEVLENRAIARILLNPADLCHASSRY